MVETTASPSILLNDEARGCDCSLSTLPFWLQPHLNSLFRGHRRQILIVAHTPVFPFVLDPGFLINQVSAEFPPQHPEEDARVTSAQSVLHTARRLAPAGRRRKTKIRPPSLRFLLMHIPHPPGAGSCTVALLLKI